MSHFINHITQSVRLAKHQFSKTHAIYTIYISKKNEVKRDEGE